MVLKIVYGIANLVNCPIEFRIVHIYLL